MLRCIVLVQERDDHGRTARNNSILLMIPELYPIVTDVLVPSEFHLGIVLEMGWPVIPAELKLSTRFSQLWCECFYGK